MKYRVAMVGATGLAGRESTEALEQQHFFVGLISLSASHHFAGKT